MKAVLFLLFKAFKFVKFAKVFSAAGTMLLSVATYAFFYVWPYAVGFVLLLFTHEMGHYLAAKKRGLAVGAPVFIPFVGAAVALKDQPHDAETEAYIGIAGPVVGTLAALACYYAGRDGGSLLLALSYSGFMLNLFNLIPVPTLDGGRVTAVLFPKLWLLGIPLLVGLFFYSPSPLLIMIAIMGIPRVWYVLRGNREEREECAYYEASPGTKIFYGIFYICLIIFLVLMATGVYELLPHR